MFRAVVLAMAVGVAGCPPREPVPHRTSAVRPLSPLPIEEAVQRINSNAQSVRGALQARGAFARGYFTDVDGRRRTFDNEASILVYPPRHLRFEMKVIGRSVMLFGSNATRYWLATRTDGDALWWGRHARAGSLEIRGVALQPVTIIQALGVGTIAPTTHRVQRVTMEHQQILLLEKGADDTLYVAREYWLSRAPGRALVRVVVRSPDGEVAMDANLSGHARVEPDGPTLPDRIVIDWPSAKGRLVLTCRSWKMIPRVDRTFAGFAFPLDRGETYDRVIDIDRRFGPNDRPQPPESAPTFDDRPPRSDAQTRTWPTGHRG